MALKEALWNFWQRHKDHWTPYLKAAGLNLSKASSHDFFSLLLEPLSVNYELKGLEEFARDGNRGIEPGDPARSLFYHVLASPHVQPEGLPTDAYLTLADIELIENCVYAADFPSLADLRVRAASNPLAVVVFAYEYAPAIDTVHRRHADLCFSRTGIARVGNAEPNYLRKERGFFPHSGSSPENVKKVHVIPARYAAFVATCLTGNNGTFGPMRFQPSDAQRQFWVPLHKLFDGRECIDGLEIKLNMSATHVNEKIRKVHLALRRECVDTGWTQQEMEGPPFRVMEGLADFGDGLVTPVVQKKLLDFAHTPEGKLVGFPVPPNNDHLFATLHFEPEGEARHSPELVHAKHKIVLGAGGKESTEYLPHTEGKDKDIAAVVGAGGYEAANFVDYTADGWVAVDCPTLALEIPKRLSAYSILAQPDFFPLVRQQDLMKWWETSSPAGIKDAIWPMAGVDPTPLSDARLPANFTLQGAHFDSTDGTMTAIVGMDRNPGPQGHILPGLPHRESTLSYRATNLFQPGWDSSQDFDRDAKSPDGAMHLANYGLGSPYAEDTFICAALGAYWPGAVPDITRFLPPNTYPSTTPILDENIGWDGLKPPTEKAGTLGYLSPQYGDYVKAILDDWLRYETFAGVTLEEYIARTLATARIYEFLGVSSDLRWTYPFLSFRHPTSKELAALTAGGVAMDSKTTYRVEVAHVAHQGTQSKEDPRLTKVTPLGPPMVFYSGPLTVVQKNPNPPGDWIVRQF